jgi:hypothetical protein
LTLSEKDSLGQYLEKYRNNRFFAIYIGKIFLKADDVFKTNAKEENDLSLLGIF